MPAAMVTVAAVLGLKAVAMAEAVAEGVTAGEHAPAAADHASTAAPGAAPAAAAANQCAAPTLAEMAGLSAEEVQVLQALGERRQTLDQRAEQYETQDELMLAAEQRLNERLTE